MTTRSEPRGPRAGATVTATGYGRRSAELVAAIRRELRELAQAEEELATAAAAAHEPNWMDATAVAGHRAAARVLRAHADRLDREVRYVREAS